MEWFAQEGYRCRFAWGRQGIRDAVERRDLIVIVDVLSFSSAVVTAVEHGGQIIPCLDVTEAQKVAEMFGAEIAVHRNRVPKEGRFSLSPLTFLELEPGTLIALPSPNGATCSRYAGPDSVVFAGCLLNAGAVAKAVIHSLQNPHSAQEGERAVTVVACGERLEHPTEEGFLRFAIEDYLGAGAILAELPLPKSPEAEVCTAAFSTTSHNLERMLRECGSGVELREKGFEADVCHAARWNLYSAVPVLQKDRFQAYSLK